MYLQHHGVKGQQWGIRNGPPYPIEDKVLRKGTKLNSVSSEYRSDIYKNRNRWMYTYRKDEEWDNAVYKGPFARYLIMYRGARFIREHEYETIKDLKMPNRNERVAEFKNLFNNKKFSKIVKNDIENVRKMLVQYQVGNPKEREEYKNFDVNNCKTSDDYKIAYNIFNHAMEAVNSYRSTIEYAKVMSKKYDAMVDDNNQGVYNLAHDPIIIFKTKEMIRDVSDPKSPHYLTIAEINANYEKVKEELAKKGMNVKL